MNRVRTLSVFVALTVLLPSLPLRAAEADKFLPDDTSLVVQVNIKQSLASPLAKKHVVPIVEQQLKQSAEFTQVLTALGFDPLKDFDSLTLATSSIASTDPEKEAGKLTVIVHGTFDLTKVHAAADAQMKQNPNQLKMSTEGSTRIYEHKADNHTGYFAFVDKSTLVVAGTKANVINAIKSGGKGPKLTKEMNAVLGRVDGKQSVWFAGVVPEEAKKGLAQLPQTADIADKIGSFSGGVTVSTDVTVGVAIHTADAKSAEAISLLLSTLKDSVTFAVTRDETLAKELGADTVKAVAGIVEGMKVGSTKETSTVNLKISEDAFLKLSKAVQMKKP